MNKNILRNILFISCLIVILSLGIVYGLLRETIIKDTPITYEVGNLRFEVSGNFKEGLLYPGENLVTNDFVIKNNSTVDVNLRIMLKFYLDDMIHEFDITSVAETFNFNENNLWTLKEDGFYHYSLNEGILSESMNIMLFSNLTLDGYKFKNTYQGKNIKIKLVVQAKQSNHVTWQDLGEKLIYS